MNNLILASASPRRKELLELAGFEFDIITADVDEVLDASLTPSQLVMSLAFQKASAVAAEHKLSTVIGADTVVVLDGKVLGKPHSSDEAKAMLGELSGRTHEVYTGVCLIKGDKVHHFFECTKVSFYPLEGELIDTYVASGECSDKAGSYGIQGKGCVLVKGIEGDYFNVVGFPVARFCREIKAFA